MLSRPLTPVQSLFAATFASFTLLLTGCGGSGGSGTPSISPFVVAKVPISWPLRARAIVGTGSALSVVVTFDGASKTNENVAFEADRNASPVAYQQTYGTGEVVRTGIDSIHVRFYSQAGAQGSLVASADASVLVKPDGSLAQANGNPLGTIQTLGQVAYVSIAGPQSVSINTPTAITTNVLDAQSDLLAISTGSIFYQVTNGSGAATIDATGNLVGSTTGTLSVTATVDGITSQPSPISVLPAALPMVTMSQTNSGIAVSPTTNNVWATVPPTASKYANSVVEINPANQSIVSSIFVGSNPTVLAFSADGSALYVGVEGSGSLARVDPVAKKLVGTYPLTPTGFGGAQYVSAIAVEPGNPNVVAVCQQGFDSSGFTGGCIYSNGVLLSSNMGIYNGAVLGFSNATTLWGSDPGFSPQSLFQGMVSSSGATLTNTNYGLGGWFNVQNGNLYFTSGQVVSGTTGNLIGTYPVQGGGVGVGVDFNTDTAYVAEGVGSNFEIASFDATSFTALTTYAIPAGPSAITNFTLTATNQFAFTDGTNIYFVSEPSSPKVHKQSNHPKL